MQKLKFQNSWEYHHYYTMIDGIVSEISDMKMVFLKEKEVYVGFPVKGRMVNQEYSDMGITYSSTSKHYYVTIKIFNDVKMEIPLDELMCKTTVYVNEKKVKKLKNVK